MDMCNRSRPTINNGRGATGKKSTCIDQKWPPPAIFNLFGTIPLESNVLHHCSKFRLHFDLNFMVWQTHILGWKWKETWSALFMCKVYYFIARNKPRIKFVNCPAGVRRGPCRDPRGQFLKESTEGSHPSPLRDPGGSLRGPDLACRNPGRFPPVPLRCPNGSRSGPFINLQGDTQLLRYEFINVQSINP